MFPCTRILRLHRENEYVYNITHFFLDSTIHTVFERNLLEVRVRPFYLVYYYEDNEDIVRI